MNRILTFTGSPLVYAQGPLPASGANALELAGALGTTEANKIQYKGVATLVIEGDVDMGKGVAAYDSGAGERRFPNTDCLSILTPETINFSDINGPEFTGYFYAEKEIYFSKQVKIAGALVANLITYDNVPDVYEVPELLYALPAGIPGGRGSASGTGGAWTVALRSLQGALQGWREVF